MKLENEIKKYLKDWTQEDEDREYRNNVLPSVVKGANAARNFNYFLKGLKKTIEKATRSNVDIDIKGDTVKITLNEWDDYSTTTGEYFLLKVLENKGWGQG